MTIVFPMAGLSQRFSNAGFSLPKYMLYVGNKSLFNLAVSSFSNYFKECNFIFIARNLYNTRLFIKKECELLKIENYKIVTLEEPTQGQAETTYIGLKKLKVKNTEPVVIFNIDTFRPDFIFPKKIKDWDGYLEVFRGEGANWSYAKTEVEPSTLVVETAEKVQISNFCSTGLYYFRTIGMFYKAFEFQNLFSINNQPKELYIAPLYNFLIREGKMIHINEIKRNEVIFCGIPEEYYQYLKNMIGKDL